MPKGRPRKIVEAPVEVKEAEVVSEVKSEVKEEETKEKEDVVLKPKLEPLSQGQAYFEDGMTGTILIGDATRDQLWFRGGNNGKGCWINKKR